MKPFAYDNDIFFSSRGCCLHQKKNVRSGVGKGVYTIYFELKKKLYEIRIVCTNHVKGNEARRNK